MRTDQREVSSREAVGCIGDDWINEAQRIPKADESDVSIF